MSDQRLRVLFAGGGSGGHLYPAIAVADELVCVADATCEFIGSSRPVEADILARTPYGHHVVESVTGADLKRNPIRAFWRLWTGVRQARKHIKAFRPDVVVGCGGFASVPTILAAKLSWLPVLLLEQNHVPGRATMMVAPLASLVCAPMEAFRLPVLGAYQCLVTGNPVRREIADLVENPVESILNNRLIVVLGGSQGSSRVNDATVAALQGATVPDDWRVLHLTGDADHARITQAYRPLSIAADVRPFHPEIVAAWREAGLVICRGGATTLSELSCAGVPAIIIPILDSVHDHQRINAAAYANAGGARMLDEICPDLPQLLASQITELTSSDAERERMIHAQRALAMPRAAARVADEVLKLVRPSRRKR